MTEDNSSPYAAAGKLVAAARPWRSGAEVTLKRPMPSCGPATRALGTCAAGVVYVEFIIAFIPMFLFFLGMIQLALMESGQLIVSMAARKAVRTAIVQIDNGDVCLSGGDTQQQNPFMSATGEARQTPQTGETDGNEVMDKIRASAYLPLATLAPRVGAYPFLGSFLDSFTFLGTHTTRMVLGYFVYNRGAAALTLLDEAGGIIEPAQIRERLAGDSRVTVRVSYLFPCVVPLVNAIMCKPLYDMVGLGDAVGNLKDRVSGMTLSQIIADPEDVWDDVETGVTEITDKAEDAVEAYKEMGRAEIPALMVPWAFSHLRFHAFVAEATLPNQWASYEKEATKKNCPEEGGGTDGG